MLTPEAKLRQLLHDCNAPNERNQNPTDYTAPTEFHAWFLQQFRSSPNANEPSLEDFALFFLSTVRQLAESHLRCNDSETPKCQTPVRTLKTDDDRSYSGNLMSRRLPLGQSHPTPCSPVVTSTPESQNKSKAYVSSSSLQNDVNSQLGTSLERSFTSSLHSGTSTPLRRAGNHSNGRRSGGSSHAAPNSGEKQSRNNSASSSICLGDFLVLNSTPTNQNRSHKKRVVQAQCHQATLAEVTPTGKPKKRVVPTTISNRSPASVDGYNEMKPFCGDSSFSNENNILRLSHSEVDDKNKCSIMAARKSLKLNASEISKELEPSARSDRDFRDIIEGKFVDETTQAGKDVSSRIANVSLPPVQLEQVSNRPTLERLADIYAILMDLNFVTNVLNEIAFLLNLLNVEEQPSMVCATEQEQKQLKSREPLVTDGLCTLANVTNCIYFALCVLRKQRHLLALLDAKSLSVILNAERISCLAGDLQSYLECVHQRKQQLEAQRSTHDSFDAFLRLDKSFKSVYYQEDKDSRQHFASNNEFAAFKTQRDLFYKALKLWEAQHLSPTWNFAYELTPKIREIFKQSENAVNMSHFAKLFVSQLLISSSDATSPEEMGLEIDAQKFNKLTQRLVAPSNFSVDYQFPRKQAFFRDFINEARSIPFAEQLKMALYSQLIALNGSSFEQLNVLVNDKGTDELDSAQYENSEFIVRPEVLTSMIILAKFFGFVTAQPYNQNSFTSMPTSVEKKQISLRSLFQPHFNVCQLLQEAIKSGKLLITLPWLVQYLAMLDNVTLQLNHFIEATQVLFQLYAGLGVTAGTHLTHTSVFILRCCLGWLFETKPIIAEQYYTYRATHTAKFQTAYESELQEIRLLIPSDLAKELPESPLCIASVQRSPNGSISCVLQPQKSPQEHKDSLQPKFDIGGNAMNANNALECLNPMVESLLNVACPFLAEFRVSIMPAKYATTRYVSRSGRYRHITTRIAELHTTNVHAGSLNSTAASSNMQQQQQQHKLIEAFLHSQNASMRRLIEFVIERSYKSVVKDAQYKFLLPSKSAADDKVNEITSSNAEVVSVGVSSIYEEAREKVQRQWQTQVPKLLEERIEKALEALLPIETTPIIRQTYSLFIHRNASQKVEQWFHANVLKGNFYCNDLAEVTQKICKANMKERQVSASSELKIVKHVPSVSDILDDLQYWLHCTSMRTDLLTTPQPIVIYLQKLPAAFENTLPTVFYRLMGASIVQLLQHIIAYKPEFLTNPLVNAACDVWLQPQMQSIISMQKTPVNVVEMECDDKNSVMLALCNTPSVYDGLVTRAFVESLGTCHARYKKLQQLLTSMIEQHVLTVDEVNVLFMPIFKADWPVDVLNEISNMLQGIAKDAATFKGATINSNDQNKRSDAKSHLLMEVLADFSRDVDNF